MVFTIFGFTVSWPLLGAILSLLLGREIWKLSYFMRAGIPGPMSLPWIGNLMNMRRGIHMFLLESQLKYGKVFGIFIFGSPIISIGDPEMIKDVAVKNFSKFVNHKPFVLKNKPFDEAISILKDQRWKNVRNIITPSFSALKMKQMSPLINECCDALLRNIGKMQKDAGEVNISGIFEAFTMDGIAKCAFGLQVDSQNDPNDPFVQNARIFTQRQLLDPILLISGIFPPIAHLFNFLNIRMFPTKVINFFLDVVKKSMDMRRNASESGRKDFLQLMMNAHEDDKHEKESEKHGTDDHDLHSLIDEHHDTSFHASKKTQKTKLTQNELFAQAMLFFVAGYETTNTTLGFIIYSLATNPDVQTALIDEIDEVTPTRDSVNYNSIAKMPYLDSVVCEALRLYPPATLTDRECSETYTYNGVTVQKGQQIFFNIFGIQRDPELWSDPETFDPTRFSKENRESRHPFAWIPFGAGPRNCIGMRFALMEIKMAVARLLQKYRFETSPNTEIPIKLGISSLKPVNGIVVTAVDRD